MKSIFLSIVLLSVALPKSIFGIPLINGVNRLAILESDSTVLVAVSTKNVFLYSDYDRIESELSEFYKEKYKDKSLLFSFDLEVFAKVKAYNSGYLKNGEEIIQFAIKRDRKHNSA